jgi:hypothetical protein
MVGLGRRSSDMLSTKLISFYIYIMNEHKYFKLYNIYKLLNKGYKYITISQYVQIIIKQYKLLSIWILYVIV